MTGKVMTKIAEDYVSSIHSGELTDYYGKKSMDKYTHVYDNLVVKFWLSLFSQNVLSTMAMFRLKDVSVKDLKSIYMTDFTGAKGSSHSPFKDWMRDAEYFNMMNAVGATRKETYIVMGVIMAEYANVFGPADSDIDHAIGKYVQVHNLSQPSEENKADVITYFSLLYDELNKRRYFVVSRSEFVAKILSGSVSCGPLNWRINMFAHRLDQMRKF